MHRRLLLAVIILISLTLGACGFHLRGMQSANLPQAYQTLRFESGGAVNTEIVALLQNALIERAGVRIANDKGLPVFVFMGERFERRVLAVNVASGTATDYLLIYRLYYQLNDAKGKVLLPRKLVYLQRDFRYDPNDALGMSREEERLQYEMRLSAVDRVLLHLSHMP